MLLGATFVDRVGTFVVTFLALYLTGERGLSLSQAGLVASAWGAGGLVGSPVGGVVSDHFGRKATLVVGLFAQAAALLHLGFADGVVHIALGTLALGFAGGFFRPAASALVADVVDDAHRPRAFALYHWVVNVAFSISPLLGAALIRTGFFTLFVVDAATSVLCAFLLWRYLPSTPLPSTSTRTSGAALAPLRDGVFVVAIALSLATGLIFHQLDVSLPVDTRAHGVDAATWGLIVALNGVLIVLCQPLVSRHLAGRPLALALGVGTLLTGLGFGINGLWPAVPGYLLGVALWTFGEIFLSPAMPLVATRLAPAELRGTYQGYMLVPLGGGFLLGPLVGTAVLEAWGSQVLWAGCAVVGVVAGVAHAPLHRAWRARVEPRIP